MDRLFLFAARYNLATMAKQQRIVTYRGNVQGVGFRYTACRVAGNYDLTGYVRNLPDGGVEILAEGDIAQIDLFLADVTQRFSGFIRTQTQQTAPYGGSFESFGVRY
jgi:acylphosphatase